MRKLTSFRRNVYSLVRKTPRGKVATYRMIARGLGNPKAVRAVGSALNQNPYRNVPCHRVIRSDGKAGGFARGTKAKIKLLRKEGIKIIRGKVDPRFVNNQLV